LGKSKIVKNMPRASIVKALKGYKKGTYGGDMKLLMKGQIARFSDAELEAIAEVITTQ
jgi:cytochrome c553